MVTHPGRCRVAGERVTLALTCDGGEERAAVTRRAPASLVAPAADAELAMEVDVPGLGSALVELLRPAPSGEYCADLVLARVDGEEVAMQVRTCNSYMHTCNKRERE